ncbi:MAG: sigma-70 family RNA polymerase sigma factor [Xanthomonadales bacterium]|nr:sigma-70 family RNA polymerase sigma factor [Xanthomonadales bacterium]
MGQGSITTIDEQTIRRARRGETEAFAEIYAAYAKRCFNLALRISGNRAVAEDVVHDAFIKVMQKIRTYRGEASLWSWIRQITANTTINVLARRKWWRSLDALTDADGDWSMPEPGSSDDRGAAEHDLVTLLGRLPVQARTVLILHDMEGMTHKEIGALFGQTESFSKSVLFRARKQLESDLQT